MGSGRIRSGGIVGKVGAPVFIRIVIRIERREEVTESDKASFVGTEIDEAGDAWIFRQIMGFGVGGGVAGVDCG